LTQVDQQAGKGGLANPWRPPENHRMQLSLLHRAPQWLTVTQQVGLTNILVEGFRPHPCGQGCKSPIVTEQGVLHQAPSRMTSTPSGYSRVKALLATAWFRRMLWKLRILCCARESAMRISWSSPLKKVSRRETNSESGFLGFRVYSSELSPSLR